MSDGEGPQDAVNNTDMAVATAAAATVTTTT